MDKGRRETTHPHVSAFIEGMTISTKTTGIIEAKWTLKKIDNIVGLV